MRVRLRRPKITLGLVRVDRSCQDVSSGWGGAPTVPFLVFVGAAVLGLAASCANAGGEVKGGELTAAGAEAAEPPFFDSGTAIGEVAIEKLCSTAEWSALYRDIFSPVGKPGSCAFNATCHGTREGAGATSGTGIECYDERGCCQSMFDKQLVSPSNASAPEQSSLIRAVLRRKTDAGTKGFMPKEPLDYTYPDESLDRIKDWIRLATAAPTNGGSDAGVNDASDN